MQPDEESVLEDDENGDEPFMDSCDECGRVLQLGLFEGDDPLLAVLPDSSAVYRDNPQNDGTRMVMVCSSDCLRKIKERVGRRPFVQGEVWAGKIAWALAAHGWKLPPGELERETGLEWLRENLLPLAPDSGDDGSAARSGDI
ncbi:hypothetical protein [Streptomyces sp. NPDC046161]|uniref:hypothetical protein n=1 Tax=Streptomyces sp. NPDC046161 TaxID=3155132 RepID=UPI003407CABF